MPRKTPDLVRPRGRPRKGEASAPSVAPARKATCNITIDADVALLLNDTAARLEAVFGFRPTISQTLRHLIVLSSKGADHA